jgi:hypothetical protein
MSGTLMPKQNKNGLKTFRNELQQLLKKRSKYIDSRSYNFYENSIASAQKKKLDEYYTILKNVKYLENKVINKKTFSSILEETKQVTKEYKVTLYAVFEIKTPKQPARLSREAVETFSVKGKSGLNKKMKMKAREFEEAYHAGGEEDYYSNEVKPIKKMEYEVSSVYKQNVPINKVPMKNAYTLHRDWLKYSEGIDKKAYDDMKGQCVYELLCEHLGDYWKTVNKQKLFSVFNQYVMDMNARSYLDDAPFDNKFTMDSGVNTDMIRYLCDQKKISLYAFDAKENCFEKVVYSHISNYKPIIYYNIDGHMYLITNKDVIKSLTCAQKANKNVVVSSLLEVEKKKEVDEKQYVDCKSFDDALSLQNTIAYLPQMDMTNEVHKYIASTKKLPKTKVNNHNIVQMEVKEKNLTIICDTNISDGYTWRDIKAICDKVQVPFTNQRIGGLISALKKKFFKPERRVLTDDEKASIVETQENKCNDCEKECAHFEYDHIMPLACGGSNDLSNFQALCKGCHLDKTMAERENSDFIKFDDVASTFNEEGLKIIKSRLYKQWAFVEKLVDKKDTLHKLDHVKCRRNLVMHNQHDFPMYSVMDYPVPYDGADVQCGDYYVETTNYYPFRGNGWYNYTMVQRALDLTIINKSNIKYMFIPSFKVAHNHFKKFAEFLVDVTDEVGISKLIVNSLVGCWGIQRSNYESMEMTLDKYQASRELIREGVFVNSKKLNNDVTIYSIMESMVINKDDMYLPLYNQIIAMEAMNLYDLEQIIIGQGGVPVERNTDAILYSGSKINIDNYYWDAENTVKKYRYDEITHLKRDDVCKFTRTEVFTPAQFKWTQYEEIDDFDSVAKSIFESNKGCMINGCAGAGKTFLANKVIDMIEASGKKCIKLAPTRKAASHIKGKTIHKYYLELFLSNNYEKKILKSLNHIDYMIVDEISMVKEVFYRFLVLLKRYQPQLKFIIIGDYDQLKPVKDTYKGDYAQSPALHHLCDAMKINLEKCRRSDAELFNVYDKVRRGGSIDINQFPQRELTKLNIAYSHKTRKQVNKLCMDKFGKDKEYLMSAPWDRNHKTQWTRLYEGLPVVSYKNDNDLNIYNSEVFTIDKIDLENKTFTIKRDEEELEFDAKEFKYMFYPAYCITIHVSQGCTFDEPYCIYDWSHPHMERSAKYVALSRSTSIHNIMICQ